MTHIPVIVDVPLLIAVVGIAVPFHLRPSFHQQLLLRVHELQGTGRRFFLSITLLQKKRREKKSLLAS